MHAERRVWSRPAPSSNCVLETYYFCTTERRVRSRAAPGPGVDPGRDPGDAKKLQKTAGS